VDVRAAPLLHRRGRLLTDLLRPVEAREDLVRAFNLSLEAGDRRAAIGVALSGAMEKNDGGTWGGGGGVPELRERALSLVAAGSKEQALLYLQRGSRADLRAALDFARATGEKHMEAQALEGLAYHELFAWELDASAAWLASAEATGGAETGRRFGLAYIRYCLGIITGSADAAARAIRELNDLARRSRSLGRLTLALGCGAFFASKRGQWDEVRRKARECAALLASSGPVYHLGLVNHVQIQTELQTGHFKAVRTCMESAAARGMWSGPIDHRSTLFGAIVSRDTSFLPPCPERVETPDADGPLMSFVTMDLLYSGALACVRNDRRIAAFCLEHLRKWKGTFWDASTDGELGLLCSVLDRLDEAVGHYEDAIAFSRRAGYLPDLATTMSNLADTLVRRDLPGDRERATGLLDESLSLCQKLGMAPLEKRARAAREALSGSEGRRRAQPDGLTHREIEVLRLVSRGFTNAEIAERLYVSALTVARHMHNLLEKTGMANRAEVTAWAGKSGFLEDK
jgi:DNA-binding CsgD family transcriptional regulator